MQFAITDRRLLFVAVVTWLQILCHRFGCRRFVVTDMTCCRFNLSLFWPGTLQTGWRWEVWLITATDHNGPQWRQIMT